MKYAVQGSTTEEKKKLAHSQEVLKIESNSSKVDLNSGVQTQHTDD